MMFQQEKADDVTTIEADEIATTPTIETATPPPPATTTMTMILPATATPTVLILLPTVIRTDTVGVAATPTIRTVTAD